LIIISYLHHLHCCLSHKPISLHCNAITNNAGNWTSGLHALATNTPPGTPIRIRVEGPYGVDWGAVATERLQAGAAVKSSSEQQHSVLMVAGGVGIAPLCSTMAHLLATAPAALSRLHVLWSVRDDAVHTMYMPVLQRAAQYGADITVHNTAGKAIPTTAPITTYTTATTTASTAATTMDAPSYSIDGKSTNTATTPATGTSKRASKRFSGKAPWNVRSPLWTWFVAMVLLWLSAIGSNAGFALGRAVCYTETIQKPPAAFEDAYKERVLANYAAANGGAEPEEGWPEDQGKIKDARIYAQQFMGKTRIRLFSIAHNYNIHNCH
jgi:Ferric reductase NAD binding domain